MGAFADAVGAHLRDALAERLPGRDWATEHRVRRTPVDLASPGDPAVLVELEWRRADPSDNPVKLARYAAEGEFDGAVVVVQVFSRHYDLDAGGVSAKRANAEFVGALADATLDGFAYRAVELDVDPPKRGSERPDGWRDAVDRTADRVADLVEGA